MLTQSVTKVLANFNYLYLRDVINERYLTQKYFQFLLYGKIENKLEFIFWLKIIVHRPFSEDLKKPKSYIN